MLEKTLAEKQMSTVIMHSKLDMKERGKNINAYRTSKTLAVATDLLARGIDIPSLRVVMNYNLPQHSNTKLADTKGYLYRIGRTCRFGKSLSFTLFSFF